MSSWRNALGIEMLITDDVRLTQEFKKAWWMHVFLTVCSDPKRKMTTKQNNVLHLPCLIASWVGWPRAFLGGGILFYFYLILFFVVFFSEKLRTKFRLIDSPVMSFHCLSFGITWCLPRMPSYRHAHISTLIIPLSLSYC